MPGRRRAAKHEASLRITSTPSPQTNVRIEHLANTRWHERPHAMQGQRDQPSESTQLMHCRINRAVGCRLDETVGQIIPRHNSRQSRESPATSPAAHVGTRRSGPVGLSKVTMVELMADTVPQR